MYAYTPAAVISPRMPAAPPSRLRARKRAMVDVLGASKAFRLSPVRDAAGDCATVVGLLFASAGEAADFERRLCSTCSRDDREPLRERYLGVFQQWNVAESTTVAAVQRD